MTTITESGNLVTIDTSQIEPGHGLAVIVTRDGCRFALIDAALDCVRACLYPGQGVEPGVMTASSGGGLTVATAEWAGDRRGN